VTDLAAAAPPAANNVVTGVLAFLVVAAMGLALFFLLRSMNKQLRKVAPGPKWREQARDGQPGATAGGDPAPGQGASTKP
jgi:hypothetical protein